LGGRVKTLHPKIFGGILYRRDSEADRKLLKAYDIPFDRFGDRGFCDPF